MKKIVLLLILLLSFVYNVAFAYDIRAVNLGTTHFLDGTPPPAGDGFYLRQYFVFYDADHLTDGTGATLNRARLSSSTSLTQLIYQSDLNVLGGQLGANVIVPYVFDLRITSNPQGFTSSGSGFDDLLVGPFIQWRPIMLNGRPFFANRFEVDVYFPTGKFRSDHAINPGFGFYSIEPYWAATLFLTRRWTISWRAHYLYSERNNKTGISGGDTFHLNFASSVALIPHRLRAGVSGYYLKQVEDSRKYGAKVPNSKEQVLGIGPGILVMLSKQAFLSFHAYFEDIAENRAEGNRYVVNLFTKL